MLWFFKCFQLNLRLPEAIKGIPTLDKECFPGETVYGIRKELLTSFDLVSLLILWLDIVLRFFSSPCIFPCSCPYSSWYWTFCLVASGEMWPGQCRISLQIFLAFLFPKPKISCNLQKRWKKKDIPVYKSHGQQRDKVTLTSSPRQERYSSQTGRGRRRQEEPQWNTQQWGSWLCLLLMPSLVHWCIQAEGSVGNLKNIPVPQVWHQELLRAAACEGAK